MLITDDVTLVVEDGGYDDEEEEEERKEIVKVSYLLLGKWPAGWTDDTSVEN